MNAEEARNQNVVMKEIFLYVRKATEAGDLSTVLQFELKNWQVKHLVNLGYHITSRREIAWHRKFN